MKVCAISDTHNHQYRLAPLPEANVLIHAGDLTSMGTVVEIVSVMKWFKTISKNYSHIVITPGNHDFLFETDEEMARDIFSEIDNLHILINEEVIIDGYKFYGSPVTIEFYNWAFNIPKDKMYIYWNEIPDDTDVLITHQPPYGIGDSVKYIDAPGIPRKKNMEHLGCKALLDKVREIEPKLHVWGHIHSSSGFYRSGKTQMINASQLDERYQNVYPPYEIEI